MEQEIIANVDEALMEFRKPWVDVPSETFFANHRNLVKCSHDLKGMISCFREYAYNDEENDHAFLKKAFEYILNAHSVYISAVSSWINNANAKKKQNISVPALPRVERLLSEYDSCIEDRLKRYFEKATRSPSERSEKSVKAILSSRSSCISAQSKELIESMLQSHAQEISSMSSQLVDAKITAEKEKQKASEKDEILRRREQDIDKFFEEKSEMKKKQQLLEKEVVKFKDLVSETMFPDASHPEFLSLPQEKRESEAKYHLRSKADEFIPTTSNIVRDHQPEEEASTSMSMRLHSSMPQAPVYAKRVVKNERCEDRKDYYDVEQSATVVEESKVPISNKLRLNQPVLDDRELHYAYERGIRDGRLQANYSALYDIPSRDTSRKFSGKKSDYPMFRQQLVRDYDMFWKTDPHLLLQRIANSVTDAVYEHIKSAWVMRNPHEGLDRIWEILEDLYGDPRGLLDTAIREVKWEKGSLASSVSSLQSYRTKLRNLQSIADSVDMSEELSRPKLLFRIVECFNASLHAQFVNEYRNFKMWHFKTVLCFLNDQIANLQFKERHSRDISAIIGEEKDSAGRKKTNSARRSSAARINNLQQSSSCPDEKSYCKQVFKPKGPNKLTKKDLKPDPCCIHPLANHRTIDCAQFIEQEVDERRALAKVNNLCFYCLGKHFARNCPSKIPCLKCKGSHSELLHRDSNSSKQVMPNQNQCSSLESAVERVCEQKVNAVKSGRPPDKTASSYLNDASVPIIALTAVEQTGSDTFCKTFYALLDTGADTSLCTRELADELFGWNPRHTIDISFLDKDPEQHICMRHNLTLKYGSNRTIRIDDLPFIDSKLPYKQCVPDYKILSKYELIGQRFPVVTGERRIDMILGAREIRKFHVLDECEWKECEPCQPLIGYHPLGTIFWGMKTDETEKHYICAVQTAPRRHYVEQIVDIISSEHCITPEDCYRQLPLLTHDINQYYRDQLVLDPDCEQMLMSRDDEKVLAFYQNNVSEVTDSKNQRRLQLPLPWKEGYPKGIPESLQVAERRVHAQSKKLSKQRENARKYADTFALMLDEEHAEKVEKLAVEHPCNYITHFATQQEKFRVVYNGALKINGLSLNDMLHRGPMFLESLVGILMRFRQYSYAVTADIKNMFFQIRLHPKDRDMLRFLPYSSDVSEENNEHWRFTVMPYGLICVPSIAGFCIQHTADKNYANASEKTVLRIKRNFYVDDFITSVETLEEAKKVITESTSLLSTTGFVLTKFCSNCREVLNDVDETLLAPSLKEINLSQDGLPRQKTLGLLWNAETDKIEFQSQKQPADSIEYLTRRTALSYLNSHFDPLGLWSPFFVKLKLCYSQIARETVDWDDVVSSELRKEWFKIKKEIQTISWLSFQRRYSTLNASVYELHLFSDASTYAMGACVYLKVQQGNIFDSSLIAGKARIFPQTRINKFSIARKELLALCMGADLLQQCQTYLTLPISDVYLWVDSTTVLKWCKCNSNQLSQFVRRRTDKILIISKGKFPQYVKSDDNPADIASRGIKSARKGEVDLWSKGPNFLRQSKKKWPTEDEVEIDESGVAEDMEPSHAWLNCVQVNETDHLLEMLSDSASAMEAEKRLVLLSRCFHSLRVESSTDRKSLSLREARLLLLKMAQAECYGRIIQSMKKDGITFEKALFKFPVKERPHYLLQLCKFVPFLAEDGLLRIGGRLDEADLAYHFKHPILLPYRHWLTQLYLEKKHAEYCHLGPDLVFGALQQDYGMWPVGGVQTVWHYTRNCLGCKLRRQARGEQLMSPLPVARLKPRSCVFTYVCSDFAGPFSVVVGRSRARRWLCIFVCMVTTAVRIEVAVDLTASAFINAFRRFLSSTGYRTTFMRTDNGTNYVGANNIIQREKKIALKNLESSTDANRKMDEWDIHWEFGPPEASHHGGLYERQIRTIRHSLESFENLQPRSPTDDEFLTCVKMAEYVMNCRPLTKSLSADGLPPLRPIDLMIGALDQNVENNIRFASSPGDDLRRGYRYTQQIAEFWWQRWMKLYLPSLQKRSKWRNQQRNFKIGDLVIICNEATPKFLKYPYGIITNVKKGADNNVRSITMRMHDGRIRERDITKIALISGVDDDD